MLHKNNCMCWLLNVKCSTGITIIKRGQRVSTNTGNNPIALSTKSVQMPMQKGLERERDYKRGWVFVEGTQVRF